MTRTSLGLLLALSLVLSPLLSSAMAGNQGYFLKGHSHCVVEVIDLSNGRLVQFPCQAPTPLTTSVVDGVPLPSGCYTSGPLIHYHGACGWLGGWGCWRDPQGTTWAVRCDGAAAH